MSPLLARVRLRLQQRPWQSCLLAALSLLALTVLASTIKAAEADAPVRLDQQHVDLQSVDRFHYNLLSHPLNNTASVLTPSPAHKRQSSLPLNIAIIHEVWHHAEVQYPLLYAMDQLTRSFAAQEPHRQGSVTLFTNSYEGWQDVQYIYPDDSDTVSHDVSVASIDVIWESERLCQYQLVVLPTGSVHGQPEDTLGKVLKHAQDCGHQFASSIRVLVVMHSPEDMDDAQLAQIDDPRVSILTLGDHVKRSVRKMLDSRQIQTPVYTYIPVAPFRLPAPTSAARPYFVLQGHIELKRRNYTQLMADLAQLKRSTIADSTDPQFEVWLLGVNHDNFVPPPVLQHCVKVVDTAKSSQQFYSNIANSIGVITAFASDQYTQSRASASVPAAYLGSVPLIATRLLVNAYGWLHEDAVWLRADDETEAAAMARIAQLSPPQIAAKKAAVRQWHAKWQQENLSMFRQIVDR